MTQLADCFEKQMRDFRDRIAWVRRFHDIQKAQGQGKMCALLTVEEGAVCQGSLEKLRLLFDRGVRMLTLTWNYPNELGFPNVTVSKEGDKKTDFYRPQTEKGLTERGIEFVREMQKMGMIVDVSHLSDAGFYDVLAHTDRPFVASHSNARACCPHVRNLPDDLLRAMGEKGCLIGLNFCPAFLDEGADRHHLTSRVTDMARHSRYIMDLAGEDALALGSDFDGIGGELEIAGAQDMPRLAEGLCKAGLTETQVEKIFWGNAARFFAENL